MTDDAPRRRRTASGGTKRSGSTPRIARPDADPTGPARVEPMHAPPTPTTAPPARSPGSPLPSPERVAALLALVFVLAFVLVRPPAAGSGPSASPPPSSATPAPTRPPFDRSAVEVIENVHADVARLADELRGELEGPSFDTAAVVPTLRGINVQLRLARDAAVRLGDDPPTADLSADLIGLYDAVRARIDAVLQNSVSNQAAYREGTADVVALLGELPALDERITALLAGPPSAPPSAVPTPASAPPSSPSPSAPPVATPTPVPATPTPVPPTVAPSPSSASPSPSGFPAIDPGQVENAGFEGSLAPWELVVSEVSSVAEATLDPEGALSGETSLRVAIAQAGASRSGITVRQGGMELTGGLRYRFSIAVRAESPREVRLRVVGAGGRTYATGVFSIGTTWALVSLDVQSLVTDGDASIHVDLGRSAVTTWLDAASFGSAPAGLP